MFKCEKCGAELEPNAKFCTSCGEKVLQNVVRTRGAKYSRTKYWIISIILLIISAFIFGFSRMLENINDLRGATIGYSIVTILQLIWVYALSNRVRDYGNNPWIALFALIPLINIVLGIYYGINRFKKDKIIRS